MAKTYTITFICFLLICFLFKSSMSLGSAVQGTACIEMDEVQISPALIQKEMKNRIKSLVYAKQTESSSIDTKLPEYTLNTTLPDFTLNKTVTDFSLNTTFPDYSLNTTLPDYSLNTTLPDNFFNTTLNLNTTVPVENVGASVTPSTNTQGGSTVTTVTTNTNTNTQGGSTTIPNSIVNGVINAINNTVVPAVTNLFKPSNSTNSGSFYSNFAQVTLGLLGIALL
jgi:hypothetical protein